MKKFSLLAKAASLVLFMGMIVSCGNQTSVPEHNHEWDEGKVTKESTCFSEGVKTFHCKFKGCKQTKTESIETKEHTWDNGVVTTEATCYSAGVMTYTCLTPGCGRTKTSEIKPNDHDFSLMGELVKVPDLLEDGIIEKHCANPGCHETKNFVAPAHADYLEQYPNYGTVYSSWNFGVFDTFDPTNPTQDNNFEPLEHDEIHECYVLGDVKVDEKYVMVAGKALILDYTFTADRDDIDVNVTANFAGKEDSTRVKGYVVTFNTDGKVSSHLDIAATSSSWNYQTETALHLEHGYSVALVLLNDGTGEPSGTLSLRFTPKCVHVWDDGVVTKEPTCIEEGTLEKSCIKCEEKKELVLATVGHSYDTGVVIKVPTLHEDGTRKYTCEVCGHEEQRTIKAGTLSIPLTEANTEARGDDITSNRWIVGNVAHVEVSETEHTEEEDIWRGGLFVNTRIKLEVGKSYILSYDIFNHDEEKGYQLCIQQGQWDGFVVDPINLSESEHVEQQFKVTTSSSELLWLFFRFGNVVNELEISNLEIVKVQTGPIEYNIELTESNTYIVTDRGIDNSKSVSNGVATITISNVYTYTDIDNIWRGGLFIDTGIAWTYGAQYKLEMDIHNHDTTKLYEVCIQDGQWADRFFNAPPTRTASDGKFEEAFTANRAPVDGHIWLFVRFGYTTNTLDISNLKITELSQVEPTKVTEIALTKENTEVRGDDITSNRWLDELDGNIMHVEVSATEHTGAGDIWRGGLFINTGIEWTNGTAYRVEMDIHNHDTTKAYEVCIQDGQYGDRFFVDPTNTTKDGSFSQDFVTERTSVDGTIWIFIRFGNVVNELEISNLVISEF